MWDTQAIIERLVERFPTIEVHNEICRATQERQEAAVLAADDVDCVVVVGSERSSNSQRLVQVVREKGHRPRISSTLPPTSTPPGSRACAGLASPRARQRRRRSRAP